MRALHLSTRLAGTDGVSLEAAKLARVLRDDFGFEPSFLAGEVETADGPAEEIPELHFRDPVAVSLGVRAFGGREVDATLEADLEARAAELAGWLREVIGRVRPDLLVLQNVWAVPMQLPLARALALVADESGLPCLSHEHDYPWERERFAACRVPEFLARNFPHHGTGVRHLCINQDARDALRARRNLRAVVLPNVLDWAVEAPTVHEGNRTFRAAIGIGDDRILFLQPTRVVPRKGIERAIDLLAARADPRDVLVIPHAAGDEGQAYLAFLTDHAERMGVDLRHVDDLVNDVPGRRDGRHLFGLADAYAHADFVTYPSLYEGFGNALLETIHARKPALVHRYPVYVRDIAPHGFDLVEIAGEITAEAVREVAHLLQDPERRRRATGHNARVAARHYSLEAMRRILAEELAALGFPPRGGARRAGSASA